MFFESQFKCISFESLVLGFISTVGSLCGKSEIRASPGFKQPLNLFCVLVGLVSSKKSVCIDLFRSCYNETMGKIKRINENENASKYSISSSANNSKFFFYI